MNSVVVQWMRTNPFPFGELEQKRKTEKFLANLRNRRGRSRSSGCCCCCSLKNENFMDIRSRALEKLLVGGRVVVVVVVVAKMKN